MDRLQMRVRQRLDRGEWEWMHVEPGNRVIRGMREIIDIGVDDVGRVGQYYMEWNTMQCTWWRVPKQHMLRLAITAYIPLVLFVRDKYNSVPPSMDFCTTSLPTTTTHVLKPCGLHLLLKIVLG